MQWGNMKRVIANIITKHRQVKYYEHTNARKRKSKKVFHVKFKGGREKSRLKTSCEHGIVKPGKPALNNRDVAENRDRKVK